VRPTPYDHVGAGIDAGVGDLDLVVEHVLEQSPVIGGDHDVGLRTQRAQIARS
jgi:hypothetical protein